MTVVAWDGKTLAADKLVTFGSTRGTVTKIFRHGGELLAITGDVSIGQELLAWYRDGAVPAEYPPSNRDPSKGASLICILPSGKVWKYESSPHPFMLEGKFAAFGCADEMALVAMECGKSAREAIEVVCKFNIHCGNGVDVLELA